MTTSLGRVLVAIIFALYGIMIWFTSFMAVQGSREALNFFIVLIGLPLGVIALALAYALITSPPVKSLKEYQMEYEELLRKVKKAIIEEGESE